MSLALVFVVGNVGSDPEVRQAGKSDVVQFSMAVNRKTGSEEFVDWYRCISFYDVHIKLIEENVRKGMKMMIWGQLAQQKWEDRDGAERYTAEVRIDKIEFADGPRADSGGRGDDRARGRDDDRGRGRGDAPRGRDDDRGRGRSDDRGGRGDAPRGREERPRDDRRDDRSRDDRGRDDRGRDDRGRDDRRRDDRAGGARAGSGRAVDNSDLDDEIPF